MASEYQKKIDGICKDIEEFLNGHRCHWAAVCKGYRKDAYTCHHQEEAITYCGLYKDFVKHKLVKSLTAYPDFELTK